MNWLGLYIERQQLFGCIIQKGKFHSFCISDVDFSGDNDRIVLQQVYNKTITLFDTTESLGVVLVVGSNLVNESDEIKKASLFAGFKKVQLFLYPIAAILACDPSVKTEKIHVIAVDEEKIIISLVEVSGERAYKIFLPLQEERQHRKRFIEKYTPYIEKNDSILIVGNVRDTLAIQKIIKDSLDVPVYRLYNFAPQMAQQAILFASNEEDTVAINCIPVINIQQINTSIIDETIVNHHAESPKTKVVTKNINQTIDSSKKQTEPPARKYLKEIMMEGSLSSEKKKLASQKLSWLGLYIERQQLFGCIIQKGKFHSFRISDVDFSGDNDRIVLRQVYDKTIALFNTIESLGVVLVIGSSLVNESDEIKKAGLLAGFKKVWLLPSPIAAILACEQPIKSKSIHVIAVNEEKITIFVVEGMGTSACKIFLILQEDYRHYRIIIQDYISNIQFSDSVLIVGNVQDTLVVRKIISNYRLYTTLYNFKEKMAQQALLFASTKANVTLNGIHEIINKAVSNENTTNKNQHHILNNNSSSQPIHVHSGRSSQKESKKETPAGNQPSTQKTGVTETKEKRYWINAQGEHITPPGNVDSTSQVKTDHGVQQTQKVNSVPVSQKKSFHWKAFFKLVIVVIILVSAVVLWNRSHPDISLWHYMESQIDQWTCKSELSLNGVALGDDQDSLKKLGTPIFVNPGGTYVYKEMEVGVTNGKVTTLVSVNEDAKTKKGVHQGSTGEEMSEKYGDEFYRTVYNGLILYEYPFKMEDGNVGILRFAADQNNVIKYISIRVADSN